MLKAATAIVVLLNCELTPLDAILPIEPKTVFIKGEIILIENIRNAGVNRANDIIIGAIPRYEKYIFFVLTNKILIPIRAVITANIMYLTVLLFISFSVSDLSSKALGDTFVASDAGLYAETNVADKPRT
ncbi:MAG: hypothetical protein WCZ17_11890, partial [Candidatus Kapaibacterium sp.]